MVEGIGRCGSRCRRCRFVLIGTRLLTKSPSGRVEEERSLAGISVVFVP
jgi:hypothetical protein